MTLKAREYSFYKKYILMMKDKTASIIYLEHKNFNLSLIFEHNDTGNFASAEINRLDGAMPTILVEGTWESGFEDFIHDFKLFADRHRVFFDLRDIIHKEEE